MAKTWVAEAVTPNWLWPVTSACLGVIVCVLADVDVFALLDVNLKVPVVGSVMSGVLISRGASFVHDLWSNLKE